MLERGPASLDVDERLMGNDQAFVIRPFLPTLQ